MDERLRTIPSLRGRYRCSTADSFAWRIVRRWRGLARRRSTQELLEDDYDQVCSLAGDLLAESTIARWVGRTFAMVVADEFQDCKGGQLAMVRSLAEFGTCIVAGDEFQDLEGAGTSPAILWARANGEGVSLSHNHRASSSGLLRASGAMRVGGTVPRNGHGFTVLGALNHNVGASFVSKNLTWWADCADIAILTPVRPSRSAFVRKLIARVEEGSFTDRHRATFGPHSVPWEVTQEEEGSKFIEDLGLPEDGDAEVCGAELSFDEAGGTGDGLQRWIERQSRVAGRATFTVAEIGREVRRIHQRSRAHQRVRRGGVRAMTIHQAKNREFHSVIVLWPYEVKGTGERARRLLYNAISRAKRRVLVVVQNPRRLQEPPFVAVSG